MAYGMTYHQFWDGDVFAHGAYRKAYKIKQDADNARLWLQGRYVYDAIYAMSPILRAFSKARKPIEYLSEPYGLDGARKKREEEEAQRERYETIKAKVAAFAEAYNKQRKEAVNSGGNDDKRD